MRRTIFNEEHEEFRTLCRDFVAKELVPAFEGFEKEGMVSREFFAKAGELGLLGLQVDTEYGGVGESDTFKFNAIVTEETAYAGVSLGTLRVHQDICTPYFVEYGTDEQKRRWLPGISDGTLITAIAMTEPGTGSDLAGIKTTAVRDGDHYVLNGGKTFISGGIIADRVIVVARTSPLDPNDRRAGLTMLVVDATSPGFERGRPLEKIGLKSQDTVELSFNNVKVPVEDLLGEEGKAFEYLSHNLPQERMTIAVNCVATAQAAVNFATEYSHERQVFGKPLKDFQNTKFVLAECSTEVAAAQALLDNALESMDRNELSVADAARVKLFATEVQARVVDKCLQIHGGYGYILEYPIARLYADARVTRIYGGTSEVMKTIIAKDMGLSAQRG